MRHAICSASRRQASHLALAVVLVVSFVFSPSGEVLAQEFTPEMLEAASRQTGLSKEELLRRYQQGQGSPAGTAEETTPPGRTDPGGIDDNAPFRDSDVQVVLPMAGPGPSAAAAAAEAAETAGADGKRFFGEDFFSLDAGVFTPPSYGPLSPDHRLGVGDEVVINVWGDVDMQLTRVVERDGSIILPRVGKVACAGRSLATVDKAVRERLATIHSSISLDGTGDEDGAGSFVEVTLGQLRAIRVFVVGQATRPGSYELSSVSTVLTALYAAGGPSDIGTYRAIEVVRGGTKVGTFDLYGYLLGGDRASDVTLQEGDTVYIADRGPSVQLKGAVRRPMHYELRADETLADLVGYAGGFAAAAAPDVIHIERILPPALRRKGAADHVFLDVVCNAATMRTADGEIVPLLDGDVVTVDAIGDRLENWVEVAGHVKRPGRYEFAAGMTVSDLLDKAGGLWPDALRERAVIDRTNPDRSFASVDVPLADVLAGDVAPVALQAMDKLEVFARWETVNRPEVHISGEVNSPLSVAWREGLTLRDLVLKAGGLKESANLLEAQVSRLRIAAVASTDLMARPEQTVDVINVALGEEFLADDGAFVLKPYDRVSIRRLPWWDMQETVAVRGEVFYPGTFSLERKDERLSSVLNRAGGLSPDAYVTGARVVRGQDGVGNIAIDLAKALAEPGSQYDIILQNGDEIVVPDQMFTVKVTGHVGFPTSLVWEDGKKINYYVDRAGGYLEKADKGKTRVVWPNGMSLPNKGGSRVVAGSTIIVPVEPPPEGKSTLETIRDITSIVASLATVWLIIDNTN